MRRTRIRPDNSWPAWRFGPDGEKAVFKSEDEVPYGWTKKPGQLFVPPPEPIRYDKEDLIRQLIDANIPIDPRWCAAHMKKVLDDPSTPR